MYSITNQLPQVLDCLYKPDPTSAAFSPIEDFQSSMVAQLLTPVDAALPVTVQDSAKNVLTVDEITDIITSTMTPDRDYTLEKRASELLGRMLKHYNVASAYPVNRAFVNQAATMEHMDFPDATTIYTAQTDVIPAAAEVLAKNDNSSKRQFFASLAFTTEPDTLGIAFRTAADFNNFKSFFTTYAQAMLPVSTNPDLHALAGQFASLTLDGKLTESLVLRQSMCDNNDEYSFARVIHCAALAYAKGYPNQAFMLPFSMDQLMCPEHLIIVNVDAHAHARPYEVTAEWNDIADSITSPLRVVTKSQLARLTATIAAKKFTQKIVANSISNNDAHLAKHLATGLPNTRPRPQDILRRIVRLIAKMGYQNRSQNSVKMQHRTYNRPSRRDPDNFNLAGKTSTTRFKPDIHIYVDTSGSISEEDYADAVKTCIRIARKLDVDIYFNSFSHVMSEDTLVSAHGRTAKQMWAQIQKTEKVTGGTDYYQIWRYIQASKKRRRELSLIITDFEWQPPNRRVYHPENLYYIPCALDWQWLKFDIERFMHNMIHIDAGIRRHILV